MGSQMNVSLPPYSFIVHVLATGKGRIFSKNSWKALEVHSEILKIRREGVGKGRGGFRNI